MKLRMMKLVVVVLFVLAGVAAFNLTRGQAQAGAVEKTVDQTRKNIQVLKGLPDSQLFPLMNFIRTSLGVSCAYCHVNNGDDKWVWESDEKPQKVTARKMMLMQMEINKDNRPIFGTTGAVTCYTCHRGQTKPLAVMLLPQPPPVGGPGAEKPKAETSALPSVEQVIGKYEQAIGGRAASEKLKSRVMKGVQVSTDGTEQPVEVDLAAPNKIVAVLTTKGGPVMTAYNGTTGWMRGPRGLRELGGAQLAQLKRAADLNANFMLRETYPGLVVVGKEKIGERETYVLASQTADNRIDRLYFDTETGLLLRVLSKTQTLLAPLPEQVDYEDYRDVDGVKLPFTVRQSFVDPWTGYTRKYTEIKHNVPVDDSKFNMPPPPAPATTPKP